MSTKYGKEITVFTLFSASCAPLFQKRTLGVLLGAGALNRVNMVVSIHYCTVASKLTYHNSFQQISQVQHRMISVDNFFVFLRLLFFAVLLYVT